MDDDHGFGETTNFVHIDKDEYDEFDDENIQNESKKEDLSIRDIENQLLSLLSYLFSKLESKIK